ncbi:MAG: XRE family transcriptional regulator [Pseudomonadota bacterium]
MSQAALAKPVDQPAESAKSRSFGNDIRALRKSKGLTLEELAARIDRSIGYLSQAERGMSDLTVDDLQKLAKVLDVPFGWFLTSHSGNPDEQGYIVRSGQRRRLGTTEDGIIEELLSPDLGGSFELVLSEIAPGARSAGIKHRGIEEAGYVVEGSFDITIDGRTFKLQANDSFRFTHEPMSWHNPGPEIARVLWVASPPVY